MGLGVLTEGLQPEHIIHPLDNSSLHRAVDKLSEHPTFKNKVDSMVREAEDEHYFMNLADNTRLGPTQGGSVYRLVEGVAACLGIPTPRVFLDTKPDINAWALGGNNPSIGLTSELVDQFTDEMVQAVVGHEIGHIFCNHTYYMMATQSLNLIGVASGLPLAGIVVMGIQWYLLDWFRKSELTADRVALLTTDDLDAVQQVIVHLAGGSSSLRDELHNENFALQADEFTKELIARREANLKLNFGAMLSAMQRLQEAGQLERTHPWPSVRFAEITDWAGSEQYAALRRGDYEAAAALPHQRIPDTHRPGAAQAEDVRDMLKTWGKGAADNLMNRINKPR